MPLQVQVGPDQVQLNWPGNWEDPSGVTRFPVYEVQSSKDLQSWRPVGSRRRGSVGAEVLTAPLGLVEPQEFFRVVGILPSATRAGLANGGAEVFGFGAQFDAELKALGQISPQQFAARYALPDEYLSGLSWSPTTARHWWQFASVLDAKEWVMLMENGFVVSGRLGGGSFADVYYDLYKKDMPVFVSADAILHAWHRSYANMLEELEETWFTATLGKILAGMHSQLPAVQQEFGAGPLRESILDADYFLSVGRSLLEGLPVASVVGQEARVVKTLDDVKAGQMKPVTLFGDCRMVDFSQFKVRGYYQNSARLGRYFQAMMWLGRIDFKVAGGPFDDGCGSRMASPRDLGAALVLHHLLKASGTFDSWFQFERALQTFVGLTDSMTFAQLGDVLNAANIKSLADLPTFDAIEKLQIDLAQSKYGFQNIRSDYFVSPLGSEQMVLPRSFTFAGQKFTLDSWAMGKFTYDSILWEGQKVMRRVPSALDVAFSVLGNSQIVPELVERMTARNGRSFRDGLPYQHHLAAVREVIDHQREGVWEESIYTQWLAVLRELSVPTTGPEYPEVMRTRAWAMKALNTQLASWTALRHDTILYAKQTSTAVILCYYPEGFVEPLPAFWNRLRGMSLRAAELIGQLDDNSTVKLPPREPWGTEKSVNLGEIRTKQIDFLKQFAGVTATLKDISDKELRQEPLSGHEIGVLTNWIQAGGQIGSGAQRRYDGVYPKLFYRSIIYPPVPVSDWDIDFQDTAGSGKWDALVADVHTNPPCPDCGDPGSVVHEANGHVDMLIIAVDNGPDRMMFAGPVLSHYEFELIGPPKRMSDSEWWSKLGQAPISGLNSYPGYVYRPSPVERPPWTRNYLLP